MTKPNKTIQFVFYQTNMGKQPVRDHLEKFNKEDTWRVGKAIKEVELGWPVGRPLCAHLKDDIWEARTKISQKRQFRLLFFVHKGKMVGLHAFIKKTQKVPKSDISIALERKKDYLNRL